MLLWLLVPAFLVVGAIPIALALAAARREVVTARRSIEALQQGVGRAARSLRTDGVALGSRVDSLRRQR